MYKNIVSIQLEPYQRILFLNDIMGVKDFKLDIMSCFYNLTYYTLNMFFIQHLRLLQKDGYWNVQKYD